LGISAFVHEDLTIGSSILGLAVPVHVVKSGKSTFDLVFVRGELREASGLLLSIDNFCEKVRHVLAQRFNLSRYLVESV